MYKHVRTAIKLLLVPLAAACADQPESTARAQEGLEATTERYIVKYRDRGRALEAVRAARGRVALELPRHAAAAAYLAADEVAALERHPAIEYVEVDAKRYPLAQTVPYGIDMVQASDPAFGTASGTRVKVCVIDSGLWTVHEDLNGLPITGESGTTWNEDGCGHGTHVAGTIAALNNTLGVVGVAPAAVALHIVRVFADDCAWTYSSGLVGAVDECRQAGAKVISMSLGGSTKSRTEENAFNSAWDAGVLSIAAAGNDGNTRMSYPASYASVMSVAALDSNKQVADFSQKNAAVDIAAPGVSVLSTVPGKSTSDVTVDGVTYTGSAIEFAALGSASGALADGGLCDSVGAWSGKVVLCERGTISFFDKVTNVQNGGGVAAVIYNNVSGGFSGTLGAGNSSNIPAIGISQEDGQFLDANKIGLNADVRNLHDPNASGYEAWDGTSMATPHVSGVAGLIWSYYPASTNADVRTALESTAEDLGVAGRDDSYGHGLVRAKLALDALAAGGGGGGVCLEAGASCSAGSDCCSGACRAGVCK